MSDFFSGGFDANAVPEDTKFAIIPAGRYPAVVTGVEWKPTKAMDGSEYLQIEVQIIDGTYRGRKLWDRFNLKNKNQVAVDIATRQLADLAVAIGRPKLTDETDLLDLPFIATLKIRPASGGYDESNEISKYSPMEAGSVAPAPAPAAAPAQTQPPTEAATVVPTPAAKPSWFS